MWAFANAKGIITTKEMKNITQRHEENYKKEKQRLDNIERRYSEKYGHDRTRWMDRVFEQMNNEMFRDLN